MTSRQASLYQTQNNYGLLNLLDPYGLRRLPAHMVQRLEEVTRVLDLLEKGDKVGVVGQRGVGIRGMGGLGKTVLAQAVAWNVSKSRQVVWLDIGQTPDHLVLINTLVKVLGGTGWFSDIRAAQSWLQNITVCSYYLFIFVINCYTRLAILEDNLLHVIQVA